VANGIKIKKTIQSDSLYLPNSLLDRIKNEPSSQGLTVETDEAKTKKRFNKIFTGIYDGEVKIDNEEVTDFQWVHPDELSKWIQQKPDDFPDGFIQGFKIYQKITAS